MRGAGFNKSGRQARHASSTDCLKHNSAAARSWQTCGIRSRCNVGTTCFNIKPRVQEREHAVQHSTVAHLLWAKCIPASYSAFAQQMGLVCVFICTFLDHHFMYFWGPGTDPSCHITCCGSVIYRPQELPILHALWIRA